MKRLTKEACESIDDIAVSVFGDSGNEYDPFNVPEDFWPTTIAIHLGKRIG